MECELHLNKAIIGGCGEAGRAAVSPKTLDLDLHATTQRDKRVDKSMKRRHVHPGDLHEPETERAGI